MKLCIILPCYSRAQETVSLIAHAYNKNQNKTGLIDIKRMNYVIEHSNAIDRMHCKKNRCPGTQNSTTKEKSDIHAQFLNNVIGVNIDSKNIEGDDNSNSKAIFIHNKNDYKQWKSEILPNIGKGVLNVIASHGGYIRKDVLGEIDDDTIQSDTGLRLNSLFDNKNKVRNLGAFLLKYDTENKPEIIAAYPEVTMYDILEPEIPEIPENLKQYLNCGHTYKSIYNIAKAEEEKVKAEEEEEEEKVKAEEEKVKEEDLKAKRRVKEYEKYDKIIDTINKSNIKDDNKNALKLKIYNIHMNELTIDDKFQKYNEVMDDLKKYKMKIKNRRYLC